MEGNQKIRPLFDNVIVKKDDSEEKSKTGIIVGSDDNPALVGVVISVGKDLTEEIKVGDKIMYAPFSGRELGGFLILSEHDIMGVIEEDGCKHSWIYLAEKNVERCDKCGIEKQR